MARVYVPAISASALNKYEECPFRYKRESLDKAYPFEESTHSSLGTAVHAILEAYYSTGVWPQAQYDFNAPLDDSVRKWVSKKMGGFLKDSTVVEVAAGLKLVKGPLPAMTAYLLTVKHFYDYPDGVDPVAVAESHKDLHATMRNSLLLEGEVYPEGRIILDKWGRRISNVFDANAMTQIESDLLVIGERRGVIIDWKTGKFNPDFVDGHVSQVELYAYHVFQAYPNIDEVHAYVIHPIAMNGGSLCRVYTRDCFEMRAIIQRATGLYDVVRRYKHGEPAPELEKKEKNGLCKAWCPVTECENNGKYEG